MDHHHKNLPQEGHFNEFDNNTAIKYIRFILIIEE